jgi:hypothetical protein
MIEPILYFETSVTTNQDGVTSLKSEDLIIPRLKPESRTVGTRFMKSTSDVFKVQNRRKGNKKPSPLRYDTVSLDTLSLAGGAPPPPPPNQKENK